LLTHNQGSMLCQLVDHKCMSLCSDQQVGVTFAA